MEKFPFYLWTKKTKIRQFWENLKEHQLTTTKCPTCNETQWPPRHMCPKCYGIDLEWIELSQKGVLETFTDIGVALKEFNPPFLVGCLRLDNNGPMIFARMRNFPSREGVELGMRCKIGFDVVGDTPIYVIEPL